MDETSRVGVRAIINLFENQCKNERKAKLYKPMSKSLTSLPNQKNLSFSFLYKNTLEHIEDKLTSYILKFEKYQTYQKKSHIKLQNELREILEMLVTLETNNNEKLMREKRKFVEIIGYEFEKLDQKLPDFEIDTFKYKPFRATRECFTPSILQLSEENKMHEVQRTPSDITDMPKAPIILGASLLSTFGGGPFNNTQRSPLVLGGKTEKLNDSEQMMSQSIINAHTSSEDMDPKKEATSRNQRPFIIGGIYGSRTFYGGDEKNDEPVVMNDGVSSSSDEETKDSSLPLETFDVIHKTPSIIELHEPSTSTDLSETSNIPKRSLIIGGFAGTKHFQRSETLNHQQPLRATSYEASLTEANGLKYSDEYKRFNSLNEHLLESNARPGSSIGHFNKLKNFFEGKQLDVPLLEPSEKTATYSSNNQLETLKMSEDDIPLLESFSEQADIEVDMNENDDLTPTPEAPIFRLQEISDGLVEDISDILDETYSITSDQSVYVDAID